MLPPVPEDKWVECRQVMPPTIYNGLVAAVSKGITTWTLKRRATAPYVTENRGLIPFAGRGARMSAAYGAGGTGPTHTTG